MSLFDKFLTVNEGVQKSVNDKESTFKKHLVELFAPIDEFIEKGNRKVLFEVLEKENIQPIEVESQKRRAKQRKINILDEISENSQELDSIKVKQEKLSIVSPDTASSGGSATFIKEISPKTKRNTRTTRLGKASESSETPAVISNVKVKAEKLSADPLADLNIKNEDMPAPRKLPPRKKKTKPEVQEPSARFTRASQRGKESDVILQDTSIIKIDITDTDSDIQSEKEVVPEKLALQNMRTTRSKMRQKKPTGETQSDNEKMENPEPETKKVRSTRTKTIKQKKRSRSHSSGEESVTSHNEQKKSRSSTSSENDDKSAQTIYEDATSTIENELPTDTTFVAKAVSKVPLDQTMMVENPKIVKSSGDNSAEATVKKVKTPPCPKSKKPTKEIFSPFEKTPLKKKIEAFEKLEAAAAVNQQSSKSKLRSDTAADSSLRPKSKLLTPFTSKFMPKTCSTNKISKYLPSSKLDTSVSSESNFSVKSLSALKSSQAEFREREKRRIEKEREAIKKREAILAAQMEEKKKKREEKQLKAQLQREILEKDKLKQLEEQQRKEEEKYKLAIAEKEEKLQKQREEAEKRRLYAKKKAQSIKQQEEREARKAAEKEAKLAALTEAKQNEIKTKTQHKEQSALPLYMTHRPPLLPTTDCYDSDSPDYGSDYKVPSWASDETLKKSLIIQNAVPENLKNTFFCRQTHTPDLREIFELIDDKKLKRTSSAVWKKPPRYTQFSVTSMVQFSDDEDIIL